MFLLGLIKMNLEEKTEEGIISKPIIIDELKNPNYRATELTRHLEALRRWRAKSGYNSRDRIFDYAA